MVKGGKQHNYHQRNNQRNLRDIVNDIKRELRDGLETLDIKKLVKPDGLISELAQVLNRKERVGRSQLRKFYSELKQIFMAVKSQKEGLSPEKQEELILKLHFLFIPIHYQKNRGKIPKEFAELLDFLVEKMIEEFDKPKAIKNAEMFFTALIAYTPKEG